LALQAALDKLAEPRPAPSVAPKEELDRQKARDGVLEARLMAIEETMRTGLAKVSSGRAAVPTAPMAPVSWIDHVKGAPPHLQLAVGGVFIFLLVLATVPWLVHSGASAGPAPVAAPSADTVAAAPARPAPSEPPVEAEPKPDPQPSAAQAAAAAQPAAAEPSAAAEAPPAAEPSPAPPIDRKQARHEMFDFLKLKRYSDAADVGQRLRAAFDLDWEAEIQLAEALRQSNRTDEAGPVYEEFLERFPTNAYADMAAFRLGNLLAKTDKAGAIAAYKRVIQFPKSKYTGEAKQALAQLGGR
jgi:TolA-binding protein